MNKKRFLIRHQIIPAIIIFIISMAGLIVWMLGYREAKYHTPVFIIAILGVIHILGTRMKRRVL